MAKTGLTFDAKKLRDMERNAHKIKKAALEGGAEGLSEVAEVTMAESQRQVPTRSGTLKNAKYIEKPKIDVAEDRVSIKFGYGGPADQMHPDTGQMASDYMVYVHEDLTAHHITGNAKFLEGPVMEAPKELAPKVALGVRNAFARVITKR